MTSTSKAATSNMDLNVYATWPAEEIRVFFFGNLIVWENLLAFVSLDVLFISHGI